MTSYNLKEIVDLKKKIKYISSISKTIIFVIITKIDSTPRVLGILVQMNTIDRDITCLVVPNGSFCSLTL